MRTNGIVSTRFVIPAKQDIDYLFGHLSDAVKANHTPATFAKDTIEITTATKKQEEGILKKLGELKASFTKIKK